ncbi:MAG: hypothetical protein ACOYOI_10180, partial [Chthoniobacterales bacterium]
INAAKASTPNESHNISRFLLEGGMDAHDPRGAEPLRAQGDRGPLGVIRAVSPSAFHAPL